MRDTMGIIIPVTEKIPPITDIRSIAALPIAGRYRIIDFVLSNMANAGIVNVGVATSSQYSSLMDHIKSGKPWDLDRKKQGLNILPPDLERTNGTIKGDIDLLNGIRNYISRSHQTYVIMSLGAGVYNMDFTKVMDAHRENQADITIVYKDMSGVEESELSRFMLIDVDGENRVTDIEVKPFYPKTANAGLGIFVMEKALLESIIDECSARGDHDFVKDAIAKKLGGMRIFGYKYDGYADIVDSMKAYYRNNMLFLEESMRKEIFNPKSPIYTKTKDQTPAKYGENAEVTNCFVSDGCVIEGKVENCILSRGVRIDKNAVVKNSIIMQGSVIEEGVELDHVVFDKEVHITKGRKLIGQECYPLAIAKGTII
ncbi:MAG: glucose-1-phosphate adenylyltransferase subunit GlgD [Clostridia bacterium]|nr:glucose-1-phosphate adenylyltransferase subunit GlgD [Clostridia bacterium]